MCIAVIFHYVVLLLSIICAVRKFRNTVGRWSVQWPFVFTIRFGSAKQAIKSSFPF